MAFLQANIYSNVLEMEVMIDVILPQSTKKKSVRKANRRAQISRCFIYCMG